MSNILDIYTDKPLRGAVDILRKHPRYYDEVSQASIDYNDREKLPDTAFAWPEQRAYPLNNRQMALLSMLYRTQLPPELMEQPVEVPPQVDENLKKAAYLHDFEMLEVEKKAPETKVASLKEEDYLLPELKKFPVRNLDEAKMVQNIMVKNAHIMGYDHLLTASKNLVNKMAKLKASTEDVNPIIYKYAGLTLSNKEFLDAAIRRRLDFAAPEYHDKYEKLASIAEDMDFNRVNLVKVAQTLEHIDYAAGMNRLYDKHITNPVESVFNTTTPVRYQTKVANEEIITPEMLPFINQDNIKELLGEDVLDEVLTDGAIDDEKVLAVLNSLPTEMVSDFAERVEYAE